MTPSSLSRQCDYANVADCRVRTKMILPVLFISMRALPQRSQGGERRRRRERERCCGKVGKEEGRKKRKLKEGKGVKRDVGVDEKERKDFGQLPKILHTLLTMIISLSLLLPVTIDQLTLTHLHTVFTSSTDVRWSAATLIRRHLNVLTAFSSVETRLTGT